MKNNPTNPRFVWIVGAVHEEFPDVPEYDGKGALVLWDRQCRRPAVSVSPEYAQALCLETTRTDDQPFTALANWLNNVTPAEFASEGIEPTRPEFLP